MVWKYKLVFIYHVNHYRTHISNVLLLLSPFCFYLSCWCLDTSFVIRTHITRTQKPLEFMGLFSLVVKMISSCWDRYRRHNWLLHQLLSESKSAIMYLWAEDAQVNGNICWLVYSWLQRDQIARTNGSCKQLNSNRISTGAWQTAKLHPSCKCSHWPPEKYNWSELFLRHNEELMHEYVIFYQEASFCININVATFL